MQQYYPRVLLNAATCHQNITRMAARAGKNSLAFRPHFKTHQSSAVGEWFRDAGVEAITVSSMKMASYFAQGGWKDIFIAFPVNLLEINAIDRLAAEVRLHVSVESAFSAKMLAQKLKNTVGVYIKIDTGYHRTGLELSDEDEIEKILAMTRQDSKLSFTGFYTHAGHTYRAADKAEIERIFKSSRDQLVELKEKYSGSCPGMVLSYGDTPSCSILEDFTGLDELRPGNFVFYDLMQTQLGACSLEDIAMVLECPVVAKNARRNELVIHGGAVHLSKESISFRGEKIFGLAATLSGNKWNLPMEDTVVLDLSQEHGIVRTNENNFRSIGIGDTIGIIPVHSCLTANQADYYITSSGDMLLKMRS